MGIVVDMFQSDRHHPRYKTTGDKVARFRNYSTKNWVTCMTFYTRRQIMHFSYFSDTLVLVSNQPPLPVDLSFYHFCQLDTLWTVFSSMRKGPDEPLVTKTTTLPARWMTHDVVWFRWLCRSRHLPLESKQDHTALRGDLVYQLSKICCICMGDRLG